jgi:hypothetical protein
VNEATHYFAPPGEPTCATAQKQELSAARRVFLTLINITVTDGGSGHLEVERMGTTFPLLYGQQIVPMTDEMTANSVPIVRYYPMTT